jgi:UDP-N-acetyl-D-mannosaminuronic acid dehydrogenase
VMADAGFLVTGVEIDDIKFKKLINGESHIHENGLSEMLNEQLNKGLFISKSIPDNADVYIIAVGTPINLKSDGSKYPKLDFIIDAAENIGGVLKNGDLVVLRSTVPIGTCRDIVLPILEKVSGLKGGIDFHLAFAPERTAEGNALKELRSLPQIIGGLNKDSLEATAAIFRDLTSILVRVDSLESAEMAKLMNNTFRDYIFAYSNQMAQIASFYNINIFNVIKAANEGYLRDPIPLPSPGVGGPCLTKDPYIFADVSAKINQNDLIFRTSRNINESMHEFVFDNICKQLLVCGKKMQDCRILFAGLAFKGYPETGDLRNSTSIEIAKLFMTFAKNLYGYDSVASEEEIIGFGLKPVNLANGFDNIDLVLFLNNSKQFEKINVFDMVRKMADKPIIFDGWNLFRWEDIVGVRPAVYMGLSFCKTTIK